MRDKFLDVWERVALRGLQVLIIAVALLWIALILTDGKP